jgi:aminoglycoside phosphotransferase (APT) family kinase protein
MITGVPAEARWIRPEPRRTLPSSLVGRIVRLAFPQCSVVNAQPLTEGLRNANFRLRLDSTPEFIVLRIYEHDASLCQKELDLLGLLAGSVPVPEVLHAAPCGWEGIPPFVLMRYVEGVSFHELKRNGDSEAIAQAAYSVGEALASIGRNTFANPGWLGPGPSVTVPLFEGVDAIPHFVDLCLDSPDLQRRMQTDLRDRTHALMWSWTERLNHLAREACLVHGDFGKRNLLVNNIAGRWSVAAVLDWEFAVSGSPLADLGHFLRYERVMRPTAEPYFSQGYRNAGGLLPENWRELARLLDLVALCESLTHAELPETVVAELIELVCATGENRDPRC